MDLQQVVSDTKYNIRTQISLSSSLYKLIKEEAKREDKSLAQVIREKVLQQLKEEEGKRRKSKERLLEIIEKVREIRESGKSGWAKVKNPHKLIRRWRKEDDEHRQKMMEKTGVTI